jgi:hypothetical protein
VAAVVVVVVAAVESLETGVGEVLLVGAPAIQLLRKLH